MMSLELKGCSTLLKLSGKNSDLYKLIFWNFNYGYLLSLHCTYLHTLWYKYTSRRWAFTSASSDSSSAYLLINLSLSSDNRSLRSFSCSAHLLLASLILWSSSIFSCFEIKLFQKTSYLLNIKWKLNNEYKLKV